MRSILMYMMFFLCSASNAQSWQSIPKQGTYNTTPYGQFSIDPYRNAIWLIMDEHVAVIENDGTIYEFGEAELGTLWTGDEICFAFNNDNIYYSKRLSGLYEFNNYTSQQVFSDQEINKITTNQDTVYMIRAGEPLYKYTPSLTIFTGYTVSNVVGKNDQVYVDIGPIGYINNDNTISLHTDPHYLLAADHDISFNRKTDTFYMATKLGISKGYNYDFFDTITPYNTTNMPSANVLEMEFDENDTLWAVFGDASDVPFAIAKLDGDTWTDEINAGNSPIDFGNFYGFEIDTLGNMWFVDNNSLHTILTPNSPAWLGVEDIKPPVVNIYPNPVKNTLTIDGLKDATSIEIRDLNGRLLKNVETGEKSVDVSQLSDGIYLIRIVTSGGESTYRFVKE